MPNVLLAEDDLDDQELLEETFAHIDPSVSITSFSTGKKILDHLDKLDDDQIPQMVILDYNIPEMNGAEILQRLNASPRYSDIIKLVWSTSDSKRYETSCLELGAQAYFVKPSNITGLEHIAKQMLTYLSPR